jgi:WhiB family transcriptional regulator, redox-sensing transcriptional regulator
MNQHQGARIVARLAARENWRSGAACRFTDPELFFPISDSGQSLEQVREAKAVCADCEVQRQCLAFAMRTRQVHGIWGGMTEQERYPARKTGQPKKSAASGGAPYAPDTEIRIGVA